MQNELKNNSEVKLSKPKRGNLTAVTHFAGKTSNFKEQLTNFEKKRLNLLE